VIAGYHADGPRTINLQTWNWKGIEVVNAHERKPETYRRGLREGLDAMQRHQLDLATLVTHAWPLDRAADAFTALEQRPPGFIKGIVQP
jgi:threonine dehydrogenase-like Zn-dependent dehydrogenase